jgi:hypothetical protein
MAGMVLSMDAGAARIQQNRDRITAAANGTTPNGEMVWTPPTSEVK